MKLAAVYLALAALITGAVLVAADGDDAGPTGGRLPDVRLASLTTFADCDEVEAWVEDAVRSGAGDGMAVMEDRAATAAPAASAADSAGGSATAGGGTDHSGTNLQEEDVDEPDVVKTNGEIIAVATGGSVRIVDPERHRELAAIGLDQDGFSSELLLSGDRLLVIGRGYRPGPNPEPRPAAGPAVDIAPVGEEVTHLTAVDVSDPSDPDVVGRAELDGGYVSARLVGDTARLVLRSSWYGPMTAGGVEADVVLPSITVDDGAAEPLVPCEEVSHPRLPSGPGTTSVVTFDVTGDLEPVDTDTITADAATVYASTDRLYVATQRWDVADPATELHAFATEGDETTYVGSGSAPGTLLNQFSLSEREGILRVATTTNGPSGSESVLTTFAEEGDRLRQVGRLDGLGPTEQIYAVRFIDDVAFVVTFRQTDPLYVVDVADPEDPELLGELKVPGFSSYLHPIDDHRLVGVGQDATDEGRRLGTQVSLFDVADLTSPQRLDVLAERDTSSPIEYDHKAFLWWPADGTVVVPVERYDPSGRLAPSYEALVVDVDGDHLTQRGTVAQRGDLPISRSLVVGGTLWTLSDAGLLASDLDSLDEVGWLAFPSPSPSGPIVGRPMPIEG